MSDNEGEDIVPKGNEWEVVALTESEHAADPGPIKEDVDTSSGNFIGEDDTEIRVMFMSGHFGFAPSTHENLPLEPEYKEKPVETGPVYNLYQVMEQQDGKLSAKHEENLHIEGLISDECQGVPELNEKSKSMSLFSSGFGDVASWMEKEQSVHGKASADISNVPESTGVTELLDSPDHVIPDASNMLKNIEDEEDNELPADLPCQSWWRRRAASFYELVKNTDPFWSVIVAAAMVGLVVIGHRWQRDKPQLIHFRPQLVINNQGSGLTPSPISLLTEVNLDISAVHMSNSTPWRIFKLRSTLH